MKYPEIASTKILRDLIYGLLLGDGYISKPRIKGGGSQLVLRHSEKQVEYLKFKINILRQYGIKMSDPKKYITTLKDKVYTVYQSQSSFLKVFEKLRKRAYPYGKKTIRSSIVRGLNPLTLAIWYLDDGTILGDKNRISGIKISTDCFSLSEHQILIKYLKRNFNIDANINRKKNNYNLFINLINSFKLASICFDYLKQIPELSYKWKAFIINSADLRVLDDSESLSSREVKTRLFLKHLLFQESDKELDKEVIVKYYGSLNNFQRSIEISNARLRAKDMTQISKKK